MPIVELARKEHILFEPNKQTFNPAEKSALDAER